MYCKICKNNVVDGSKYCPVCGAQMEEPVKNEISNNNSNYQTKMNYHQNQTAYQTQSYNTQYNQNNMISNNNYFQKVMNNNIVQNTINILFFAMICVSFDFLLDIINLIKSSGSTYYEFHLYNISFVFGYIKNMAILLGLRVLLTNIYDSILELLNSKNRELNKKIDDIQKDVSYKFNILNENINQNKNN